MLRERTKMKAIIAKSYGGPEVLELVETDPPEVTDEQVLVRVKAVGLNAADWHMMRGEPYLVRLMNGLRRPKQAIQGLDLAGVVESTGPGVTRFQPGDEVFGETGRALAEFVATNHANLIAKPANVSFEQAAAVPVAALTALQGLRDHGKLQPGESVLINGASGGVGPFAIQIAKALGAGHVTAVCSTRNIEQSVALGADEVVDYTSEDFTESGGRYDLVLEIVGDRRPAELKRVLNNGGRCVMIGAKGMGNWIGALTYILRAKRAGFAQFTAKQTPEDLATLAGMLESGEITPIVERTYPLAKAAEAMAYVDAGHARAKVVVTL